METVFGYLERLTYYNEENSFTVAKLQEAGKPGLTTIVGNLAGINPGESLRVYGNWVHNKKFGEQFQVQRFEIVVPATVNGIEKYLGSGLIKGIGRVMAKRIVACFGIETLTIIEEKPERLVEVEGVGLKRSQMIATAWQEQMGIKEVMLFLQDHGVSASYSAKIYKRYGNESIQVVQNNPYQLAAEIRGIGFLTADRIAENLGIDPQSLIRVKEGVIFLLNQLADEGHVYFPRESLVKKAEALLEVPGELIHEALTELAQEERIICVDVEVSMKVGREESSEGMHSERVYLTAFYHAERGIAQKLVTLKNTPSRIRPLDREKVLAWTEERLGIQFAEKQIEAITAATQEKVLLITGGPGVGKTTIIRAILEIYKALNLQIVLAAPTGRAAKRMQEATGGYSAKTIHRLLEFSPQKPGFQRNQEHPLDAELVIIDEATMMDTVLTNNLLKAIPLHAVLVLVGDVNQLPSVGAGSVYQDIIASGCFPVVVLKEIFRQARESQITTNAHRINQGQFPQTLKGENQLDSDFFFFKVLEPDHVLEQILSLCQKRIPQRFGLHPTRDIQVLSPMNRGSLGVQNLNVLLQEVLNPRTQKVTRGSRVFKLQDKVMQITNNYDKEVYNGDIGWIANLDLEEQKIGVNFDGRLVFYDFADLDELVLAYAISIHKAQGSEYPAVILPVVTQHYLLLQRNLIYTGVTRGKNLVILVGQPKALAIAVRNNKTQMRYTGLGDWLIQLAQGEGIHFAQEDGAPEEPGKSFF